MLVNYYSWKKRRAISKAACSSFIPSGLYIIAACPGLTDRSGCGLKVWTSPIGWAHGVQWRQGRTAALSGHWRA